MANLLNLPSEIIDTILQNSQHDFCEGSPAVTVPPQFNTTQGTRRSYDHHRILLDNSMSIPIPHLRRPRRTWVLDFPDLKCLLAYFGPGGPGALGTGDTRLRAVRIILLTWMDRATLNRQRQPSIDCEFAFEAMQILLQNRQRLSGLEFVRIYYPDTNRPATVNFLPGGRHRIMLDSPGIFHLFQLRVTLLRFEPTTATNAAYFQPLATTLCQEVMSLGGNPWTPHNVNGRSELQTDTWNIGMIEPGPNGQARVYMQYLELARRYRRMHHRVERMRRTWQRKLDTVAGDIQYFQQRITRVQTCDDATLRGDIQKQDEHRAVHDALGPSRRATRATALHMLGIQNGVPQGYLNILNARQQQFTRENVEAVNYVNSLFKQRSLRATTARATKIAEMNSKLRFLKKKERHLRKLYEAAENGVNGEGKLVDSADLRALDAVWMNRNDRSLKYVPISIPIHRPYLQADPNR